MTDGAAATTLQDLRFRSGHDDRTWREVQEVKNGRNRSKKVSRKPPPLQISASSDRVLERLPTDVKRDALYVYAKYVAGFAGVTNMEILFDLSELSKVTSDMDLMSYSPVLLAAISSTAQYLEVVCRREGLVKINWEDIVKDSTHELFEAFARLTSFNLRTSIATRPNAITALRQSIASTIVMVNEEVIFEQCVINWGRGGYRGYR